MNKLRNRFSSLNEKTERVKEKEHRIWAEVGKLGFALTLLDVIIRGLLLDEPFKEWSGSLAVFFIITFYYCIRALIAGVLLPKIDSEEKKRKRVKEQLIESIAAALIITWFTMYHIGFPHTFTGWFKYLLLCLLCGAVLFMIRYIIVILLFKRSNKRS
ncbi:DUF6773 family protein [Bacillus atrophaeus]|uniref:DUF6773 family protein n=1 Tax=Bacillus atrophaeus TaxID=1452 RepID=UPI002281DBD2|nr:DUF6773 family protein [Bacillus atrophaeus]MCY8859439.1 hypothetical protein [Bacillus atrophaeus]MEC2309185.1 hypothetical protein [Bacillus atrophaeus]MED1015885.1 hypothetical protein [Bacillus atrophaeus]MED1032604.1 hypothetical protein [Bacillus atrophaeus]MED1118155.1 hypothetical protein [Bacillus atrophaeus]